MTSPFETPVQANSHLVPCNLQEFTDNAPFFSINTVLDVLEPGITSDIDDRPVVLINGDQDTIESLKMEMKMYG